MSVREYIGARYVPLFIGQWDNTVSYEPLSIVEDNGNSYTSRQHVPIGIDINNTAYWALTGNYNAQIEQYRQEVETYDNRIDTLEDCIPSVSFDSTNTVKKYIDDIDTAIDNRIDTLEDCIPSVSFDSTNTVKKYIDDIDTAIDNRIDTLEDCIPSVSFNSTNTVKKYIDERIDGVDVTIENLKDIIKNDAAEDEVTLIYVSVSTGDDDNPGTIDEPLKTLDAAFNMLQSLNKRDWYINITSGGTYHTSVKFFTNVVAHIVHNNIDEIVTVAFDATEVRAYNSYIHFEGTTDNKLNVLMNTYHQDYGGLYFYCVNFTYYHIYCGNIGLTFSTGVMYCKDYSGNNNMTDCELLIIDATLKKNTNSGYFLQCRGGWINLMGVLTLDGIISSDPFINLIGMFTQFEATSVTGINNTAFTNNFVSLQRSILYVRDTFETAAIALTNQTALCRGTGLLLNMSGVYKQNQLVNA